ncbi:unnamed protein product [Knipowitschia caucasica]
MEHTAVTEASSEVQGPALDPNPKQSHVETPLCAHESEFSDLLSPTEVCISSNTKLLKEEKNYEVQQAFRIFTDFLTEKHKHITSPFLRPAVDKDEEPRHGHAKVSPSICLRRMEEKFVHQEYRSITEFVADFRSMLENCYRRHGVDHWLSKQAQRLEVLLEQKLTLLSRKLREKTTLAVTSKGRFSVGEEPASSTRRRQTRHVQTLTAGGHETAMVQRLRLEEQLRTREEKRQRELEKKEAEEMSAKEMDDWEQSLLSQASPHSVESLWELPAIGHFLCLAQTALNLPEIVFFELERCLLMPRCSTLLSKTMSALLCPPQRRSTLHRRPALPYRRWEFELRQRVLVWYRSVGSSRDQAAHAEQLGLCHRFFSVLGRSSPLEAAPFHLLPFYQRVWLLKGLCDHVYETQREVQKAVLAQPIHECRESILGYDSKENAYIHFPHFCGADLRIYCQSPCSPPNFPFSSVLVEKVEILLKKEAEIPVKNIGVYGAILDQKTIKTEIDTGCKIESTDEESVDSFHSLMSKPGDNIPNDNSGKPKVNNYAPIERPIIKRISHQTKPELVLESKTFRNETESLFHPEPAFVYKKTQDDQGRTPEHTKIHVKPEQGPCCPEGGANISLNEGETKAKQRRSQPRDQSTTEKRKSREGIDLTPSKKIKNERHSEPYFKLICTNLDDLRDLINKTENELDDLQRRKKKLNPWYLKKEAVRELHSTLIRLLNELTPWEPKLIKAYQRNRLRIKKEFEVFKSHPEYLNFVREESVSSSEEEEEQGSVICRDPETIALPLQFGGTVPDLSTRTDCQKPALTATSVNHNSLPITCRSHSLLEPHFHNTTPVQAKSYTPIPTLLAKSVGNKVTLMRQPVDHLEMDSLVGDRRRSVGSTADNMSKTNCSSTATGPSLKSLQKQKSYLSCDEMKAQNVDSLPPKILVHTDKTTTSLQQFDMMTNSSEMDAKVSTSRETRTPLHNPVPPSENLGLRGISSCPSSISSFLSSQQSTSSPKSKAKQQSDNESSSLSMCTSEELKTVCVRESQSILVTTRGGNTGIVKVQKSSGQTGVFPHSPIITISPQFQAFLVSKKPPSTIGKSDTLVQSGVERSSISLDQEVGKSLPTANCPSLTTSSGYISNHQSTTSSPGKPITPVSSPPAKTHLNTSLRNFITCPSLDTADLMRKPQLIHTNGDTNSHVAKYILISPSSPATTTSSTIPERGPDPVLKPATITGALTSSTIGKNPINSVSTSVFTSSGISPDPVQFSCPITVHPHNTQPPKHHDALAVTTTAPGFQKSTAISNVPTPTTSLSSLKHLGVSSITINSQLGNVTCSSSKSVSAGNQLSRNSTVHLAALQSTSNNLFLSNARGSKTFLPQISFTKPQKIPEIESSPSSTSSTPTRSVQQQLVINTSTHLAGGTRIVVNKAHFVVPPQGLGPGSHVLVIPGPNLPHTSVGTKASGPFQGVKTERILLQAKLPSPVVAGQVSTPVITAPRVVSAHNSDSISQSICLQTADSVGHTKEASIVSSFPRILPLVSTVTNASAIGSSFRSEGLISTSKTGPPFSCLPAPVSSGVSMQPRPDVSEPVKVAVPPCSQVSTSLTQTQANPGRGVPTVSSSTSAALMHMGLGKLVGHETREPSATCRLHDHTGQ